MTPSAMLETAPLGDDVPVVSLKIAASTLITSTAVEEGCEPALLHRSLLERPHKVASASGNNLYLEDGRTILDGCGGAAVAAIGHGNQEVIADTLAQMQKVSYVHTISYTTSSAEDLAHCILDPRDGFDPKLERAYFINSGSEANDAAMKCARQYWYEKGETQRKYFVSRRQAYHGATVGPMSISTNLARKIPYADILLPNVSFVSPAYAYQYQRDSETEEQFVARLLAEIDAEFQRLGPENIISFIAEPVVGATSGCVPAPKDYFTGVRALCDKYNILLHLDEVMCGMGRTGTYFAFEQESVLPDLATIGKGLGGGYAPIAALLINGKIVDALRKGTSSFNHGHTYQAHPVTCAAALSVQKIIRRDGLVARCAVQGEKLERMLRETLADSKYVGNVRGRGLFWGVEFVKDRKNRTPFDKSIGFGLRVQQAAFELGVALYPGAGTFDGVSGDHVLVMPSYTVTDDELTLMVDVLKKAYESQERYVDSL
ncbi:MAG: hypothetical protein M1818_006973 [Claussenomyces sp. TS43310]|nr:MAG: hypothetical protein M1818_006973 [Claussenomyces sp. TS43310]